MIEFSDTEEQNRNMEQDEAAAEGDSKSTQKKRKKKKRKVDYYDLDDDFVDDSEIIDMLETQHEDENAELAHSGFFVNSGNIEVINRPKEKKRAKLSGTSFGNGNVDPALLASLEELQDSGKPVVVQDWKTDPVCVSAFENFVTACTPVFEISDAKARKAAA